MLKRQRPVSPPSFSADLPLVPPDPLLMDVAAQRIPKRRRTAAPVLDGQSRGWGVGHSTEEEDDGEENGDDDGEEDEDEHRWSYDMRGGRSKGGPTEAGAYTSTNSFLHDLHAEHQHRLVFSSSSPLSHCHHPAKGLLFPPLLTGSKGLEEAQIPDRDEVQKVRETYGDRNRMLGSLFLSRRRALLGEEGPDEDRKLHRGDHR